MWRHALRRWACVTAFAVFLSAFGTTGFVREPSAQSSRAPRTPAAVEKNASEPTPRPGTLRDEMRRRAEETTVSQTAGGERVEATLLSQPLFRYSDQPRGILDATLWGWVIDGRPVAFQKIEAYRSDPDDRKRIYCLASLSTGRIEVEWPVRRPWSSKEAGIVFQPLRNAPAPVESQVGRLVQMKNLARRFSATMIDEPVDNRQEMRLLPQPIHRYSHPQSQLRDAAVFGLASNGTNPDALLIIELHDDRPPNENPADSAGVAGWRYALCRMTQGRLSVRLDGREIWTKPYDKGPADFANWLWFADFEELPGAPGK